jgi:pimeloyl-ACP methyl ester carboxylesterase
MPRDKMLPLRTPKLELLALQPIPVTSPDGVALAAYAWGNPNGREIVFIHGFSQCHLAWRRQMDDAALAAEFRMVAYDLRGHGSSDQPLVRERYRDDRLWADDLATVIAAAGLKRPTLVAWSYAGRVVADYVRFHGQDGIAAVNYVAAVTKSDRTFWGPALKYTAEMASNDLAVNVRASRRFVHACFAGRPAGEEMEITLAYTMAVSAKARALVMARTPNEGDILGELRVPVLVTHGSMDRIILPAAGSYTAAHVPGARLSTYDGIGHSPFFEDPARFNRELAAFVRGANRCDGREKP